MRFHGLLILRDWALISNPYLPEWRGLRHTHPTEIDTKATCTIARFFVSKISRGSPARAGAEPPNFRTKIRMR
ncbi:hypothetical protein, partial [Roseicyclus sp.]|uniref:hypothetical protein n=1 Tax=Roseicyclus sp. TaxID=1914329 RepID=UPI001BCDC2A5